MTVSDVIAARASAAAEPEGGGARARVRARSSVTESDTARVSWVRRHADVVATDFRSAWLWDAHGVTVRALWDNRIPDRSKVPGANQGLWMAWCAYNHAALVVLIPLLLAAWVLCHPGRLIYAAPGVATLTTLWLI